ncbi:hypothetical protein NAEGRDRAFT_66507 [Naegleria gruberi]|uniref:Uncharacterized protein n=1 Tax=Naegleria gruberi TaxID=5762 RepID=D2VCB0_NAEGR|nr:uncharacterized protein NAEGRDRAFT_66507 [Naegleria gruberi]EFC45623.1 hypothetical protein NAEGRDRAFT_66507 [Naegleria gruberi]|eukprot:XP_002678367.1 hypothetical protein NAEGRDRAFT_66507 [Naegleria gruberi strain NEG-M]
MTRNNNNNKRKSSDSSGKQKKRKIQTGELPSSIPLDSRDGEGEVDFILESGDFEYKPEYEEWNQVPSEKQLVFSVIWGVFAKCARCKINQHLDMNASCTINHETLGSCAHQVFYLMMKDSKGEFRRWYQDVWWNGIRKRSKCIQFIFRNCLPNFDKYDDWGMVLILHTNNTSQFGTLKCRQQMNITRMSITCNIETGEVWSSFRFKKSIEKVR